jgi:hypothetical protein
VAEQRDRMRGSVNDQCQWRLLRGAVFEFDHNRKPVAGDTEQVDFAPALPISTMCGPAGVSIGRSEVARNAGMAWRVSKTRRASSGC